MLGYGTYGLDDPADQGEEDALGDSKAIPPPGMTKKDDKGECEKDDNASGDTSDAQDDDDVKDSKAPKNDVSGDTPSAHDDDGCEDDDDDNDNREGGEEDGEGNTDASVNASPLHNDMEVNDVPGKAPDAHEDDDGEEEEDDDN